MVFRFAARTLCAAGIALCFTLPTPARAEDDATIEMARQRFREGVQFYDQQKYEKARLAFLQAYTLKPHPSVLLNLAQSELRADRPDDSANHFAEYLRSNPSGDAERQEAEGGFKAAKAKTGEITVGVEPSGAQVIVDGVDKGVAPLAGPVYVVPGTHTVEARSSEGRTSKSVVVGAGQATSLTLSIRAASAPAEAAASEKPAEEASAESSSEASASAEVDTSERRNFFEWLTDTPPAMVTAGVGIAGLATGGVFAALAHRQYDAAEQYKGYITEKYKIDSKNQELSELGPCNFPDVKDLKTQAAKDILNSPANDTNVTVGEAYRSSCKDFADARDTGNTFRTIAIAGTVVGGAAIVGTVIYYFVDGKEPAAASAQKPGTVRAQVVPWMGTQQAGLTVIGSF
jgi:hypothetical protein